MPGSLLLSSSPTLRGVTRNESTRSDSSAASNTSQSSVAGNKKVSFNKAVRVKKYPRQRKSDASLFDRDHDDATTNSNGETPGSPGKRFWFKVYKNKHRQNPDPSEFRRKNEVIYYGNDIHDNTNGYHDDVISYHPNPSALNYPVLTSECGTQTPNKKSDSSSRTALLGNEYTPLHPSQMPSDPPAVKRNYVKKIVNRFNEEAVLQRQRSNEGDPAGSPPVSPPGSPRLHSTPKHIPIPPPPPPPVPPPGYETNRSPPPEGLFSTSRFKKNPIVNGVKVMFGMGQLKKEKNDSYHDDHLIPNGETKSYGKGLHKTEIVISDGSETDVKSPYSPSDKFLYGDYGDNNVIAKRGNTFDVSRKNGINNDDDYNYYYENGDERERKSKYHVETWDSGNQLLFDTEDVNTATSKTDKGEFMSTVGEKHQLWRNNKRIIVYEEPSPTIIRRKAKSQSDLTNSVGKHSYEEKLDKGVSTDELFTRKTDKKDTLNKKQKDSWLRHFKSSTKDKGIQCSKIPLDEPEELYGFGRYKIIRPRNGVVSTFSNVPIPNKTKHNDQTLVNNIDNNSKDSSVIYSQIDKSKKKRHSDKDKKKSNLFSEEGRIGGLFKSRSEPLYIGPPPKSQQHVEDELEENFFEDRGERVVRTSKKSFGFKLHTGKEESSKNSYEEQDWYNIDGDVEANQRHRKNRNHRDIAEVRQELAFEEETDASSLSNGEKRNGGGAGSVIREMDYKKREISYENVPRPEENRAEQTVGSGLWYRDADEDYRKEMAQSEVSYPAGNSVGSDRFYTVDRREKSSKKLPPPSPRAYTLDRRHLKNKDKQKQIPNTSGVKILVNGKEVKEKSSRKLKKREDPSSVQSDPLYVRGGLAAAYQARQRAGVRRSNSTASGLSSKYRGSSSPNIRRIVAGSSEISAASSESESGKTRRPLVMYIPGISHPEKASENQDRVSSTIARSHSMMTPTRPPRMSKRSSHKSHKNSKSDHTYRNGDIFEEDEIMPLASDYNRKKPPRVPVNSRKQSDIKRSHSMPKDTKFSWLKWKIRGKPSREP